MWQGFLTLGLGLLMTLWVGRRERALFYLLLIAYVLRAGLALTHAFVFPLPDSQADAITFERVAATWAAAGWASWLAHFTSGAYFYSWSVTFFYLLLGPSPLMAQALNVIAGTLTVYNMYQAAESLWGQCYGLRAAWIMALFPLSLLYSAITMRESFMLLFFTWGLVGWVQAMKRPHWLPYTQALAGFFLATILHTAMIWGIVVTLLQFGVLLVEQLRFGKLSRFVLEVGGIGGAIIAITMWKGWGLDKIWGMFKGSVSPLEFVTSSLLSASRGRSVYLPGLIPRTWVNLIWMTPIRMLGFLFAPLWSIREWKDLLAFIIAFLWLLLLGLVLRSVKQAWNVSRGSRWLVVVLLLTWISLSLTVSNYGTSIRHSLKLLPMILLIIPYPGF